MEYIIGFVLGILIALIGFLIFNALKEFRYPRWLKWILNLEGFRSQRKASTDKNIGEELLKLEDPTESPGLIPQFFLSGYGTIILILLLGFLYFFYAGVLEKAFAPRKGQELNQFFDFTAVPRALRLENPEQFPNFLVILFPSIFFVFTYVAHFFLSKSRIGKAIKIVKIFWRCLWVIIVFLCFFEIILAMKILENLKQAAAIKEAFLRRVQSETLTLKPSGFLNVLAIIFLGFVSSLLFSVGLYCNLQNWGKVSALKKIKNRMKLDPIEDQDRTELSDNLDL